jgi:hypothetical protein
MRLDDDSFTVIETDHRVEVVAHRCMVEATKPK